jgi:phosphoribosyl 1,2-cyclic phosphodiesterase
MELIVLGSSSAGNGYILTNGKESLIIEAGEPIAKAKQALNFNLKSVQGLIFTHEHGDHAKHVLKYAEAGINCHSSAGTIKALKSSSLRYKALKINAWQEVGSFRIFPFDVVHDCAEPVGFIIQHEETGNVLFLTDTHFNKYVFNGLNNIIIEANYCEEIVLQKLQSFEIKSFLANRIYSSHLEIKNTIEALQKTDLSQVNNIVLIHLSDKNSNAESFKTRVSNATGKKTTVAEPGTKINFNKLAF